MNFTRYAWQQIHNSSFIIYPVISFFFLKQTETVDIGTCDQAVPKAYTDKGIVKLLDLIFLTL